MRRVENTRFWIAPPPPVNEKHCLYLSLKRPTFIGRTPVPKAVLASLLIGLSLCTHAHFVNGLFVYGDGAALLCADNETVV